MEELEQRRGSARLAIALLAAAAVLSAPVSPSRAEGDVNREAAAGELTRQALPPPAGSGAPAPVRVFTDARGRTCRVYERTVIIDGTPNTALATICREPNGRWVLSR